MTVSKFFGILLKLIMYPFAFYWAIKFFLLNERNLSWSDHWNEMGPLFIGSFVTFIILSIITLVCFIAYCIYNKNRAFVIVFAPRYVFDNFWENVNKAFDN